MATLHDGAARHLDDGLAPLIRSRKRSLRFARTRGFAARGSWLSARAWSADRRFRRSDECRSLRVCDDEPRGQSERTLAERVRRIRSESSPRQPDQRDQLHADSAALRLDEHALERLVHHVPAVGDRLQSSSSALASSSCFSSRGLQLGLRALTTSCDSRPMRPMPRAAVVARPSVLALTALRPSSAPKIVAATDTPACSFDSVACCCWRCDAGLGAANPVFQGCQLRRVALAHSGHFRVTLLAQRRLQADAEIALRFVGVRDDLRARALQQLDAPATARPTA